MEKIEEAREKLDRALAGTAVRDAVLIYADGYATAVLDAAEWGYARGYAGADESDAVAVAFRALRERIGAPIPEKG